MSFPVSSRWHFDYDYWHANVFRLNTSEKCEVKCSLYDEHWSYDQFMVHGETLKRAALSRTHSDLTTKSLIPKNFRVHSKLQKDQIKCSGWVFQNTTCLEEAKNGHLIQNGRLSVECYLWFWDFLVNLRMIEMCIRCGVCTWIWPSWLHRLLCHVSWLFEYVKAVKFAIHL